MIQVEKETGKNFEHSMDSFVQKVGTVRDRATNLQKRADELAPAQTEIKSAALEELLSALEELHVAEEELRAQNEELAIARAIVEAERQRYQELFEFAPDGYLVTDDVGIIKEANRTVASLFKISQQKLKGKPLVNFVPYEQRRCFRSKLNQLHKLDLTQEWELQLCNREGTTFDAAVTISTVRDREGKLSGWRWLVRDITVRKQTEAQIRNIQMQNLQLQETARLKSHFLAIMSHELRSPMNAIIGFSQLLLRYPQATLAPKQENMVQRILNSGRHLLTLIDDILDFSKLEAGKLELKLQELNLAEIVTATQEEMRSLAEQKNLTMEVKLNLHNPVIVNDKTRLRQILVNLLSNAIKFTEVGGVQVEVGEVTENKIAIAVKDTGIGIAESDLGYIFEEFRQGNQTLTREHGGTGLGLAITNRLVEIIHGKITVESNLDQGTTFVVEIPRHVVEQKFRSPDA
jgi:PAS domain S-box-containing protein